MSIILEALKKSERSRRLGETPTLGTSVESSASTSEPSANLVPLLMVAISAIVMGWFGWQQFSVPEPLVDTTGEPAVISQGETPVAETPEVAKPKPRTMTEVFRTQSKRRAKPKTEEPAASTDEKQRLKQSFDNFASEQENEPLEILPETSITNSDSEGDGSQAATQELQGQGESAEMKPHITEPISYWELPQSIRESLPEIRITVLVFAENPEDRFLLNDGQRLVEQDELDDGLVLDEIRRDGAVFKFRKYRFLVKG
jgi:general secretion pathway protein B